MEYWQSGARGNFVCSSCARSHRVEHRLRTTVDTVTVCDIWWIGARKRQGHTKTNLGGSACVVIM